MIIKMLKEDIFLIEVQEYLLDTELSKKLIDNPPEWLKKVGDEHNQQEYLRERVLINFFERFEYRIDENFKGYKLVLKS